MKLSVIIPTRNRAAFLEKVLDSITRQTIHPSRFEVIVVDNGSSDGTPKVFSRYSQVLPNSTYYFDDRPGLHVGRHIGFRKAKGEILVYCDDDIEAFPGWLSGIEQSFADDQVGLVGGKALPKFEAEPPDWFDRLWEKTPQGRYSEYFSLLDFGDSICEVEPYFVFGCNFSIRKNILEDLKGFHPDGMPGELVLWRGDGESAVAKAIQERGYKIVYNPDASVFHAVTKNRMTAGYLYSRTFAAGVSGSYAEIRRNGPKQGSGFTGSIEHTVRTFLAYISCLPSKHFDVMYAIKKGYIDGRHHHAAAVRKDPRLLSWITKNHYLEENP